MPPKPPSFKTVSSFNYSQLGNLYAQVAEHQRLKQRVCSLLPESLAQAVLHCAIKNRKLLVYTHSPVWSSQLRFYQGTILANLTQKAGSPADSMQVKIVAMQSGASTSRFYRAGVPSAGTLTALQKQSAALPDEALRQSFRKLLTTLKKVSV